MIFDEYCCNVATEKTKESEMICKESVKSRLFFVKKKHGSRHRRDVSVKTYLSNIGEYKLRTDKEDIERYKAADQAGKSLTLATNYF